MRYFFVLFDVSMEISPRQLHLGEIGHTLPKCYISVGKTINLRVKWLEV